MPSTNLVTVELISGQILRFEIDRPEVLLAQLKASDPEQFFTRNQVYFNNANTLVGIPSDKIAFVRFDFPFDPGWEFPVAASRVELMDREVFESQMAVKQVQIRLVLQNALLGTDVVILQRANLVNGTVLHLSMALKTVPAMIRMQNVEKVTTMKTYFAHTKDGGYIIFNRAAIAFWHAIPGPLMAPEGAISFSEELPETSVPRES